MQLIDFDSRFRDYLRLWVDAHEDEYEDPDDMELAVPEVYEQFLDSPADWLQGQKPGSYFDQWTDPRLLIRWMGEYLQAGVSMPDMLLNRIAGLQEASEAPLYELLLNECSAEEKMLAVTLLREIGSQRPLQLYVDWQCDRAQDDELCDNALDSLEQMGEAARAALLEALEGASTAGREALLSLLSRLQPDDRVLEGLLLLLKEQPRRRAVIAAYLGRLGDERALPALMEEALLEDLPYLDYIELRSAIEALGGEAPERSFYDDPEYEALFGLMP